MENLLESQIKKDKNMMMHTYVFDFYNLYIPKRKKYVNRDLGIRITPLKVAEIFEKNRRKISSSFSKDGWKIAKCYIKAKNAEIAKGIAGSLEFLYSFAQNRSVFFINWYKYNEGKKYSSFYSKLIEQRENRFPELICGVKTDGLIYSRDINLFIDIALKTLTSSKEQDTQEILTTIYAYTLSKSQIVQELKFLIIWTALERLSNSYYNIYKSSNKLFDKSEITKLKKILNYVLRFYSFIKRDKRLWTVIRNIDRTYLYEHNTYQKVLMYLGSLDLGFDKKKLSNLLESLIEIRGKLVHNLNSALLVKKPQKLFYLQKVMEVVILRLLGIDKSLQAKFLLNQYKGKEI